MRGKQLTHCNPQKPEKEKKLLSQTKITLKTRYTHTHKPGGAGWGGGG